MLCALWGKAGGYVCDRGLGRTRGVVPVADWCMWGAFACVRRFVGSEYSLCFVRACEGRENRGPRGFYGMPGHLVQVSSLERASRTGAGPEVLSVTLD